MESPTPDTLPDPVVKVFAERIRQRHATTPWEVLGVAAGCSVDEVQTAFRSAAQAYHPHRFAQFGREARDLANEVFIELKTARDRALRATPTTPPPRKAPQATPPAVRSPPPAPSPTPKTAPVAVQRRPVATHPPAFAEALDHAAGGRWDEALARLRVLTVRYPTELLYRLHLHVVTAHQRLAEGAPDDAEAHLRRAVALDAAFAPAVDALERLVGPRPQSRPVSDEHGDDGPVDGSSILRRIGPLFDE